MGVVVELLNVRKDFPVELAIFFISNIKFGKPGREFIKHFKRSGYKLLLLSERKRVLGQIVEMGIIFAHFYFGLLSL